MEVNMFIVAILYGAIGIPMSAALISTALGNLVAEKIGAGIDKDTAEIAVYRVAQEKAPWPLLENGFVAQMEVGDGSQMKLSDLPLNGGVWLCTHAEEGMMARAIAPKGIMTPEGISAVRVVR